MRPRLCDWFRGAPPTRKQFLKSDIKNVYQITTFAKSLIRNNMFLMQSLKNICFWTSLEGALGSAGFPRWENICFLKSDLQKLLQMTTFDKNLTRDDAFLIQSHKNTCFWTSLEGASGSAGFLIRVCALIIWCRCLLIVTVAELLDFVLNCWSWVCCRTCVRYFALFSFWILI